MTYKKYSRYPTSDIKELFKAILSLKNEEEYAKFFRDLLTIAEIEEFANRWKMARLLSEGKSYMETAQLTHSSTTTVARVAHWLFNGEGGYDIVLSRQFSKKLRQKKIERKVKRLMYKPSSLISDLVK